MSKKQGQRAAWVRVSANDAGRRHEVVDLRLADEEVAS